MTPRVSVVIPVYERQASLERAIRSVDQQIDLPAGAIETIIVDDASPTAAKVDENENRRLIRHQVNKGAAGARNTGIQAARGELLAFLDSDDAWLPNHLASLTAAYEKLTRDHPDTLFAVGNGFYDPARNGSGVRARLPMAGKGAALFASGCWFCPGSAIMLPRQAFDLVGPQDESLRRLEDMDWFIRFGLAGGVFSPTDQVTTVIDPSGETTPNIVNDTARKFSAKFGKSGTMPLPRQAWNRLAAYLALEKGVVELNHGRPLSAVLQLGESLLRKPRLRPALESFWLESREVPAEVHRLLEDMKHNR